MAVEKMPGDKVFSINMPSTTKDKKRIPPEEREKYINAVAESFANINGGATLIPKCKGIYLSKNNEYICEDITIVQSHGENPFSDEELTLLCKDLNQESLWMQEAGNNIAYSFYDEAPKDVTQYSKVIYSDGSKIYISREIDPNNPEGDPVLLVDHYDASGRIVNRHYYPIGTGEDEMLEYVYMP